MRIRTIEWKNNVIRIIDQTKLPGELVYLEIKDLKTLWQAIKELKVRGAPALGAAAGFGVYLGLKDLKTEDFRQFNRKSEEVISYISSSRPTAKNLFWGLSRMRDVVLAHAHDTIPAVKKALFQETRKIVSEDMASCRKIGDLGAQFIKNGDVILTVCNAGALATIDYGTALGVIYKAKSQGKRCKVYSCETRPLLQGARLTTWELTKNGVDVTLICDNMAATLMSQGAVSLVIAGADRIASNGDTANKIGTYSLAVLSHYHKIPFYIAAPESTFDLGIASGKDIPIEQRDKKEVTELFYKRPMALKGVKVYNPAFDVTPSELITAIITDKGIIKAPYKKNIKRILSPSYHVTSHQ